MANPANGALIGDLRSQIGPIGGVEDYDALVARLQALGITDPYLVAM